MVDPAKVAVIREWQQLKNASEVHSFLGLADKYRKFVERFSKITLPLTSLTHKGKKVEWNEQCEQNFQELKEKLTSALVLTILEGTDGFVIYTNAFKMGFRVVLMQHDKVVTYASK